MGEVKALSTFTVSTKAGPKRGTATIRDSRAAATGRRWNIAGTSSIATNSKWSVPLTRCATPATKNSRKRGAEARASNPASRGGEREDGDARGAFAQPRQRQKKAEHGQRRNGLQNVGDNENRLCPSRRPGEPDSGGDGDDGGKKHGGAGEPKVLDGQCGDFAAVLREEAGGHGRVPGAAACSPR